MEEKSVFGLQVIQGPLRQLLAYKNEIIACFAIYRGRACLTLFQEGQWSRGDLLLADGNLP